MSRNTATMDALQSQRWGVRRDCLALCEALARAYAWSLASTDDLRETLLARYDELAALDLLIASYDPQGALFLDYKDGQQ